MPSHKQGTDDIQRVHSVDTELFGAMGAVAAEIIISQRIAIYARVSTKDKGQDYENQVRDLRDFVARKATDGWVLVEEFLDKASGKSAERPAFRRMFEAASRKEFDPVLFW
jgi:predicted site-specific integrase-resolvase